MIRPSPKPGHVVGADCRPARDTADPNGPQTFVFDGTERSFLLATPTDYDGRTAMPLVLNFHGFASNKELQEANTTMAAVGTERGFIVVTPDGLGSPMQWNVFSVPAQADDFAFVHALVADLKAQLCIDDERVYAAGHSNGSAFSAFLVCDAPYEFAAVAMVSVTTPSNCPDGVAPATLAIPGTADPQVPYDGGTIVGLSIALPAAVAVIEGYANRYGCGELTEETIADGVTAIRYSGCDGGAEVVLDSVEGGTHSWPGGVAAINDPTNSVAGREFSATDEILDFFERNPRVDS